MDAVSASTEPELTEPIPPRRPYNGALRRERAAETRERIITAGGELLHESSIRNWQALTIQPSRNGRGSTSGPSTGTSATSGGYTTR